MGSKFSATPAAWCGERIDCGTSPIAVDCDALAIHLMGSARFQSWSLDDVECVVYTTHMSQFGDYIRKRREELQDESAAAYSLRKVAAAARIEPSYLSKIERGLQPPPGEATIVALSQVLQEDPDVMLALAGKVSDELQRIIQQRPQLFGQLIRQLKNMPDDAVLRVVREVRDGNW